MTDEKPYNFTFSGEKTQLIVDALLELPAKLSMELLNEIKAEIDAQNKQKDEVEK